MKAERKLMMHWQNEKYLTESQNEINLNIGIGSKNMEDEWKYSPSLLWRRSWRLNLFPSVGEVLWPHKLGHQRLSLSQEPDGSSGLLPWKFHVVFRFIENLHSKSNFSSWVHFCICVLWPKLSLRKHYNCEKQTCESPVFWGLFLGTACAPPLLERKNTNVPRWKWVSVHVFLRSYG